MARVTRGRNIGLDIYVRIICYSWEQLKHTYIQIDTWNGNWISADYRNKYRESTVYKWFCIRISSNSSRAKRHKLEASSRDWRRKHRAGPNRRFGCLPVFHRIGWGIRCMMPNQMACIGAQSGVMSRWHVLMHGFWREYRERKLTLDSGEQVLKTYTSLRLLITNMHLCLLRLCHIYYILLTEMGIYAWIIQH